MNEKKKMNPFLKAFLITVSVLVLAIVFGVVSGGIFLGVSIGGTVIANKTGITTVQEPASDDIAEPSSDDASEEPSEEPSEDIDNQIAVADTVAEAVAAANLTDVSDVVEQVMPSIVSIVAVQEMDYYGVTMDSEGAGSGFIVGQNDTDLFVATNYHVIEDTKEIKVQFCDNETIEAEVKGKNIAMDLAVLAISLEYIPEETREAIHVAAIGSSEDLRVGEPAIAIGNALGYGQSVTTGVISAINREIQLQNGSTGVFIQTDAAINPGNSGGALLNTKGEVIGINSNKLGGTVIEGMGYAIPISAAKPIIDGLIDKKPIDALPEEEQGYIGISGLSITSDIAAAQSVETPYGVYISEVVKGGPAELAGLQKGDIIVGFNGNLIESMEDLKSYLSEIHEGTTVMVEYMRLENDQYVRSMCEVVVTAKP